VVTGKTTLFLLITAGNDVMSGGVGSGGGELQSRRGWPLTTRL